MKKDTLLGWQQMRNTTYSTVLLLAFKADLHSNRGDVYAPHRPRYASFRAGATHQLCRSCPLDIPIFRAPLDCVLANKSS